ncbi:glucose-6-phosphate isomerase [Marivibrio halodurans]|uniref:Glucose-6-phosphate isomerase n=1 Tax=Marivibrio halodurans TaxID=2039722 RepID=A0A8J7SNZ3_9PROT|nr:glucose-6-phosphate isomerase [Marivibrio halodurans]MBP5858303.1 glucose-6-phosphate isomerase [Marivibrio halodurans]
MAALSTNETAAPTAPAGTSAPLYRQSVDQCLAETIGEGGLSASALDRLCADLDPVLEGLRRRMREADTALPFLDLARARTDLDALEDRAAHYRESFTDVLVLGTGGSSLGGSALYEMASREHDSGLPKLHIVTNVDPMIFERMVNRFDFTRTGVIVISKSGGTTETMMQFMAILPIIRAQVGDAGLAGRITLITEPGPRPLRALGERFGLPVLDHDPRIGGRYSVLSLVGMLPTMIAGLDAGAVRAGAATILEDTLSPGRRARESDPALGAAISVGLQRERGVGASVMLAYSDRLGSLARWYRQLWAESLGKNGQGTTPIYGTGPVDQHSQLQLWLDGPADKMFTVMGGPNEATGVRLDPDLIVDPSIAYMGGRTLGDLMEASRRATTETLANHGRPVRRIDMRRIDEASMGALMMHFMLETVLAAALLDVDPFDQPAVESGKVLIRRYLRELGEN